MTQSLKEAFERSGIVNQMRERTEMENKERERVRNERNAALLPHQRWWQNFRMSATPFEIPIFIKVQCDQWIEGLNFIRARNLNKVTTRCRTREEAIEQLQVKIAAWQKEYVLKPNEQPPAGALLYWRIY